MKLELDNLDTHITREDIGRYDAKSRTQYSCGNFTAPRKKDVIAEIERVYLRADALGFILVKK